MFYLFLALFSFLFVVLPIRLSPLGRALAAWSFLACLTYGLILVQQFDTSVLPKSLTQFISDDGGISTPQALAAMMTLGLAIFAGLNGRSLGGPSSQPTSFRIQVHPGLSLALIVLATLVSFWLLFELGPDTLMSYQGYGAIKDLNTRFADNALGLVIAGTYRPIIMLLITLSVMNYVSGRKDMFIVALFPIAIAFVIGLAEGSRVTALYLSIFAACFFVTGKRNIAFFLIVPILLCVGYSLEARRHSTLGLAYAPQYFVSGITSTFLPNVLANVSAGHLVTSACAEMADPGAYSPWFKILSFLPSLGGIDGFQAVREANEQRVSFFVPFNAFGEAWAFGIPYYILLWSILSVSVVVVNGTARYGRIAMAVMVGAFLFGFMYATQYPVRNSIRYFYVLILARFGIEWFMARQRRSAAKRPAYGRFEAGRLESQPKPDG